MTHTLIVDKIEHDAEDVDRLSDEIDFSVECDGSCNLWMECSKCSEPEGYDFEEVEVHGQPHERREGFWAVIDIKSCAAGHIDSANEAVQEAVRDAHRFASPLSVGQRIPFDLNYEGDDWWGVDLKPSDSQERS
jgi:hypothetical protein